ncbi:microtubule associated MAP65/ASE1 family protein [Trifolium pratense]|uniref:Microtubule associated MAP65/ASE1 family protein n=1 Tax=Trifolium pratense TaxID=57577 RepID=A0A2K3NAT3_TRIPR|nr:microtubule associated MAP65/ASE1 family protein [Trifolium pratense]
MHNVFNFKMTPVPSSVLMSMAMTPVLSSAPFGCDMTPPVQEIEYSFEERRLAHYMLA